MCGGRCRTGLRSPNPSRWRRWHGRRAGIRYQGCLEPLYPTTNAGNWTTVCVVERRMDVSARAAILLGLAALSGCDGGKDPMSRGAPTSESATATPTSTTAASASAPLATASSPTLGSALDAPTPEGCSAIPRLSLRSATDVVALDVVYYGESSPTCGWDVDGEAMFDDTFRPERAVLSTDSVLAIGVDQAGELQVGIHLLAPDTRVATLGTDDASTAGRDRTRWLALPGAGCFVVAVTWIDGGRSGQFVGLAASHPGACESD